MAARHVIHILNVGAGIEMSGVHTRPVVASVKDAWLVNGGFTVKGHIDPNVSTPKSPIIEQPSVTFMVQRPGPRPTCVLIITSLRISLESFRQG